jgi:hypothetical protein
MKKIFTILCSLIITSSVFAAVEFNDNGTTDNTKLDNFKTSTKVRLYVNSDTDNFNAGAKHLNGNTAFGVSSDLQQIYTKSIDPGTDISENDIPDVSTNFDNDSNWKVK